MFTGIIETSGMIQAITREQTNVTIRVQSSISTELTIDQSVAHDGVCLTVIRQEDDWHEVTLIDETIQRSTFKNMHVGQKVNIERCTKMGGRLDGHIVQGHVDTTTSCLKVSDAHGSFVYRFALPREDSHLIVMKGSITINGISLTVSEVGVEYFEVSIIPYTHDFTNISDCRVGSLVNIEYDIIGKYVAKHMVRAND